MGGGEGGWGGSAEWGVRVGGWGGWQGGLWRLLVAERWLGCPKTAFDPLPALRPAPRPPQVLCMHGGIGRSINSIDQIEELQRPLTMEDGGIVLMDLLWSDPTTNDAVEGVQPSPRGPGLVTFGPDRVMEFCRVSLSAGQLLIAGS